MTEREQVDTNHNKVRLLEDNRESEGPSKKKKKEIAAGDDRQAVQPLMARGGNVGRNANDVRTNKCFRCNEEGHRRNECPRKNEPRRCYGCGELGHVKKDCPREARQ